MTKTILTSLTFTIATYFLITMALSSQTVTKTESNDVYVCTPCNSACDSVNYNEGGICNHCKMPLLLKGDIDKKMTIAFYLQDGVEILDFAGPMEVFAYAGYDVFTVSKTKNPIVTQGILKIIPDYSIEDAPYADILAFFGGNSSKASQDKSVINWVKSQKNIKHYFSVCTGAFVLAESGILKNKSATTFHNALDNLEQNYPEIQVVKNARFVDNGTVITTAGISAGIDGALHLVAKLNGFNAARRTAYYMEYDKWIPGEGLILTKDNPYTGFTDVDKLKLYVGTYEYLDDLQLQIIIDKNEKSLFASVDSMTYPLFYHKNDSITNLSGDTVIFERKDSHIISGFKSSKYGDRLFVKLD